MSTDSLKLDPLGYFLIRITKKEIEVAFCNYQKEFLHTFSGNASKLFQDIIKKLPSLTLDHQAYLKKELLRAEKAIKSHTEYIQD